MSETQKEIKTPEPAPLGVKVQRLVGQSSDGEMNIDFSCSSLGRQRSTGEIICLLLSLDRNEAAQIVADVIKTMDISVDEVVAWHGDTTCPECGMSRYLHIDNGGCF